MKRKKNEGSAFCKDCVRWNKCVQLKYKLKWINCPYKNMKKEIKLWKKKYVALRDNTQEIIKVWDYEACRWRCGLWQRTK